MNTDTHPMDTAAASFSDEQNLTILHNALLVAGHQMGETGDHWPVIKLTIDKLLKDWEIVKAEKEFTESYRHQFETLIKKMETELLVCAADEKPAVESILFKMREMFDARFTPVTVDHFTESEASVPMHLKRAENLIKMLEESDD